MARDRFHEYLDYCAQVEPISVGDYLEKLGVKEHLAWTRLMIDCLDTYKAGRIRKIKTSNGGVAYVR